MKWDKNVSNYFLLLQMNHKRPRILIFIWRVKLWSTSWKPSPPWRPTSCSFQLLPVSPPAVILFTVLPLSFPVNPPHPHPPDCHLIISACDPPCHYALQPQSPKFSAVQSLPQERLVCSQCKPTVLDLNQHCAAAVALCRAADKVGRHPVILNTPVI